MSVDFGASPSIPDACRSHNRSVTLCRRLVTVVLPVFHALYGGGRLVVEHVLEGQLAGNARVHPQRPLQCGSCTVIGLNQRHLDSKTSRSNGCRQRTCNHSGRSRVAPAQQSNTHLFTLVKSSSTYFQAAAAAEGIVRLRRAEQLCHALMQLCWYAVMHADSSGRITCFQVAIATGGMQLLLCVKCSVIRPCSIY